jgi:hypothetical protein
MKDGKLILNGKDMGNAKPVAATNGVLWPVNQVPKRPTKHVIDVLREEPRFSMFYRLVRETDSLWPILTEGMSGTEHVIFNGFSAANNVNVSNDAFLLPNNQAFINAGFNTYADLWALNERSMPYFDWDWWEMRNGEFVTDSLVAYHLWGRKFGPTGGWGPGKPIPTMFFQSDLKPELIGNFEVTGYNSLGDVPAFVNPLEFGNEGGVITVRVKGFNKTAAKVVDGDIYTYEGPLHMVDQLFLADKVKF